jgi:hypothetical protein
VVLFSTGAISSAADVLPADLRCQYRRNPLGIDVCRPRLSWDVRPVDPDRRGLRQTAYQVLVASTPQKLADEQADLWDSGKIASDQSIQVAYAGKDLGSRVECRWKVRIWDQEDRVSDWSEPAVWTMGLLDRGDCSAQWIAAGQQPEEPLPLLRKSFQVAKPVRRATMSICGLGQYELYLNGQRVGDRELDPGWTNYRKTCLYATYDVTQQIHSGANALGVMLGNGMYHVGGGRYVKFIGSFGRPKLICQLHLQFTDGTSADVVSNEVWRTIAGPITFSCIYGGEDYDARREQPGWTSPGFDDSSWQAAVVDQGPGGSLVSESQPPIQVVQVLRPVRVSQPKPGVYLYDLGQNFSGRPQLTVRGAAGDRVRITPAEILTKDGLANQSASGGPHNYTYTLKGGQPETWHPQFTYYGFRYLQVEGAVPASEAVGGKPAVLELVGQFMRAGADRVGSFTCSNELFNKIHTLVDWAIGSNLQSVLTDCPHREKLGWLEVAHLMAPSIVLNYDAAAFYRKVARDTSESQRDNGLVPDIAPEYTVFSGGFVDSPEWGSTSVLVPWLLYQWYGDRQILDQQYPTMKRYVDYLTSTAKDHIVSHGLGDWADFIRGGGVGKSQLTPKSLTATAIYAHDCRVLAQTAELLGNAQDAQHYAALADATGDALNRALFHADTHQYATGSQTSNAMPLALGLVAADQRAAVMANLVEEVQRRDYITAGDVGFRYLLRAMAAGDRSDLVHRLIDRTTLPGYGYQIQQGATSLTEAWDGRTVVSQNHCMLGHIVEWFHQELLGIQRDPTEVAFKKIIIRPRVTGQLAWAKGHYDCVYGRIASDWQIEQGRLTLAIEIPANTTATVYVPVGDPAAVAESGRPAGKSEGVVFVRSEGGAAVYRVGSGRYTFRGPFAAKKP